jgi:hypothetical protein
MYLLRYETARTLEVLIVVEMFNHSVSDALVVPVKIHNVDEITRHAICCIVERRKESKTVVVFYYRDQITNCGKSQ